MATTRARKKKTKKLDGYIYILTSPALAGGWLKIGKTTRTPEQRAAEISRGTGVPVPYEVAFAVPVTNCHEAEKAIHKALDGRRAASNREFFVLPLPEAIDTVVSIASHHQSDALRRAFPTRQRSPSRAAGIEIGAGLFQIFGLGHLYAGRIGQWIGLMVAWWMVLAVNMYVVLSSDSTAGWVSLGVCWAVWAVGAASHAAWVARRP